MRQVMLVVSAVVVIVTGVNQPTPLIAQATTKPYYVGTCKPGKADYTTIQEAVTGVPSGSTINVCPGVYPEQVTIQQPLTLQGVTSGNNGAVIIAAPASGVLSAVVATSPVDSVAQLTVYNSGGAVNISGVTVDGTGVSVSGNGAAGILYNSSPGTLNHVVVQNLSLPGNVAAYGVLFRDDSSVSPADTIENSLVYLASSDATFGISASTTVFVQSTGLPGSSSGSITANILNNFITAANPSVVANQIYVLASGIDIELNVSATITGNTVTLGVLTPNSSSSPTTTGGLSAGINVYQNSSPVKINGNSVVGAYDGVVLAGPGSPVTIANNILAPSSEGIMLSQVSGATITGNQIVPSNIKFGVTSSLQAGIDLGCSATVPVMSGNLFMSTPVALANVPNGISLQSSAGKYFNVPTIEQLCP